MWIATNDKPYYPEVLMFALKEDAEEQAREWAEEYGEGEDARGYKVHVCVAEVVSAVEIHTFY